MNDLNINLFKKLPLEIIREYILPYAYNCQSKLLCFDINSFFLIYNYLMKSYYLRYRFLGRNPIWKQWLVNDIARFMNKDVATIYGYTDNCIDIYKRLYSLKHKSNYDIREYVWYLTNQENDNKTIRTNIALLNIEERILLVNFINESINIQSLLNNF